MTDPQRDSFLRRWSSRKSDVRQGKAPAPEPVREPANAQRPGVASTVTTSSAGEVEPAAPAPTLDEVGQLTPESDFSPFVRHDVSADVKNAAMKKLFTDPHFNVMDGLDVYIDDYSLPDPLEPAMLRRMASAQFMELVDTPPDGKLDSSGQATVPDAPTESVAHYDTPSSSPPPLNHDHADLRLQPDPNAGPQDAGPDTV